jgi:hypothetical protein
MVVGFFYVHQDHNLNSKMIFRSLVFVLIMYILGILKMKEASYNSQRHSHATEMNSLYKVNTELSSKSRYIQIPF